MSKNRTKSVEVKFVPESAEPDGEFTVVLEGDPDTDYIVVVDRPTGTNNRYEAHTDDEGEWSQVINNDTDGTYTVNVFYPVQDAVATATGRGA